MAQTPDTDLNQHVRRECTRLESAHIVEQMRSGVVVPHTSATTCIDMMMQVLSDALLHLIAREAGEFFKSLNMRESALRRK